MTTTKLVPPRLVPSVEEYVAAFKKIEPEMTENQRRMLVNHHNAPSHVVTSPELARSVGFDGMGGANLWYGKLGQILGKALGLDRYWAISTIVLFVRHGAPGNEHWLWVMRENAARALEELGWAPKTSDLFFPTSPIQEDPNVVDIDTDTKT